MTIAEIKVNLAEQGIAFQASATKAELLALLSQSAEATKSVAGPIETVDLTKDSVTVYDPHGNPHRIFSREVHGDEFADKAQQFISWREGWTAR